MRTFTETLEAGKRVRLPCNGFNFNLFSSSSPLNLNFITQGKGETGDICNDIVSGFWYESPTLLTFVEMTSTVNQVVQWSVSNGRAGYTRIAGDVSAKIQQGNISGNYKIELSSSTPAQLNPAIDTIKRIIFTADKSNTGDIYIGSDSVNSDNGAIILSAGDSYIETHCCAAVFYAIADDDGDKVRISVGALL